MGRQASHVSLECALQSQANMVCSVFFKSVCRACSCMLSINGSVVSCLVAIIILWSICNLVQVLLGEEVATSKLTLFDVTKQLCDAIQARGEQGKKCHAFRKIKVVFWLF